MIGATGFAVDEGALPGRSTLYRRLGLDGAAGVVPHTATGPLVSGTFVSQKRLEKTVGWSIAYPPGHTVGDRLPVVVTLHGFGGSHASAFDSRFRLDRFLAAAVRSGAAPFAIASIDGGNTYWHRRTSGEDAGAMVTDEFVPLLASKGLDTRRIGLHGWSMGAYGALLLAGQMGAGRVAAVASESVAIWHTADRATASAFDSPADFATHTLYGRQHLLDGIAVRVDCGTGDGFFPNDRDYVAGFTARPAGGFEPGAHDSAYWRRMAPAQLAFLAAHL
ncbi:hypothetical protein AX769_01230 [Frondihabitans sp. PAMC 28766]|nr:hypothetical protein AX769_01230 [Frondihabitans sp. PAMC 28766]